jgi:hypothetical protein
MVHCSYNNQTDYIQVSYNNSENSLAWLPKFTIVDVLALICLAVLGIFLVNQVRTAPLRLNQPAPSYNPSYGVSPGRTRKAIG